MISVLTWNLFHGRSVPGAGRSLLDEFSSRLAAWEWDAALLQEVPPWWPPKLAAAADADYRSALTSRNAALPLRRPLAQRWPDVLKASGGGANTVLCRGRIIEDQIISLRRWPERRIAQLVGIEPGICVVNVHASTRPLLAQREVDDLVGVACDWARGRPLILGGDLNLGDPHVPMRLAARGALDFVFVSGLRPEREGVFPDRSLQDGGRLLALSDHRALVATLACTG